MRRSIVVPLQLLWAASMVATASAQSGAAAPATDANPAAAAQAAPPEAAATISIETSAAVPSEAEQPAAAAPPLAPPSSAQQPAGTAAQPAADKLRVLDPDAPEAIDAAAEAPPSAALEDFSKSAPPWLARITWDQTYNTAGFTRGDEPTFNPEYAWLFLVEAGYKPDALTRLYVRQDMSVELTDSDSTNTGQEVLFADTIAEVWRTFVDEKLGAQSVIFAGRLGAALPLSKASQAGEVIATSRVRLDGRVSWPAVLRGLDAGLSLRQYHRFATSNVAHAEAPFPCDVQDTDVSLGCTQLPGSSTVRDIFAFTLDAELELIPDFSVGALLWFEWDLAHGLGAERIEHSGTTEVIDDGSATHWRNSRIVEIYVGYTFAPWLLGRAHATSTFAERDPGSELRAPFNALDTVLGLEITVKLEALYESMQHGGSG